MYQNLFLYRCSKNTSIKVLEDLYARIEGRVNVRIRDISHGAEDEKANVFSSIISALHKRDSESYELPILTVLKTAESEYFLVLSVPASIKDEDVKNILASIFSSNNYEMLRILGGNPRSKEESEKYWAGIFEGDETTSMGMVAAARKTGEKVEEILTVNPEITGALRDPLNSQIDVESLCATIWGMIACKYFETESVLLEFKYENGKLPKIPLKVDSSSGFMNSYAFSEMQLKNALDYNNLIFEELEASSGCNFHNTMAFSIGFYDRYRYAHLLTGLHPGIPYKLRHLDDSELPFCAYCYYCDTIMRIKYSYDAGLVKNSGILSMHNAFSQVLERFLSPARDVNINKIYLRPDSEPSEQRITNYISKILSRHEIFQFYNIEELNNFSSKCRIINKFADETILEEGKHSDSLYILTEGKVVVETIGKDRCVKTVLVLRPGNLFGVDSLLNDSPVDFTYRAVTEIVEAVSIPSDFLKSELDLHPKLHMIIMNIQNNQLNKLAKLFASKDI